MVNDKNLIPVTIALGVVWASAVTIELVKANKEQPQQQPQHATVKTI